MITRDFVKKNVNVAWKADNSKSIRELQVSYRSLEETMVDSFQVMIDHNLVKG